MKSNRYTTQNSQVILEYYYIVNFQDLFNPKLLPVYFLNRRAAEQGIEKHIPKESRRWYSVMKGAKVIKYVIPFVLKQGTMINATKYDYPPERVTQQDKKNYRTVMRRRLRRMGIYTKIEPKRRFWEKPKIIKLIKNTQKIANSPSTVAQVFRLQRKPEYLYYRIIKKKLTTKSGKLFKVKAIRYNSKTGEIKRVAIYILRNDLVIPYLLTELDKIAESNGHTEYLGWHIPTLKDLCKGK